MESNRQAVRRIGCARCRRCRRPRFCPVADQVGHVRHDRRHSSDHAALQGIRRGSEEGNQRQARHRRAARWRAAVPSHRGGQDRGRRPGAARRGLSGLHLGRRAAFLDGQPALPGAQRPGAREGLADHRQVHGAAVREGGREESFLSYLAGAEHFRQGQADPHDRGFQGPQDPLDGRQAGRDVEAARRLVGQPDHGRGAGRHGARRGRRVPHCRLQRDRREVVRVRAVGLAGRRPYRRVPTTR